MPATDSLPLDALHHVALAVNDVASAVAWYSARFKCRVTYQDASWAMLEFSNIRVALVGEGRHPPHIGVMLPHAEEFGELGTHRDGLRYIYLQDPSGNTVEVLKQE